MRKITSFQFITLNGYYKDINNGIAWHKHGREEGEYSAESLKSDNILLFGRTTYEMMASFWPTPAAYEGFPVVAEGMNKAEKIVFSKTMQKASWNNSRIISGNITDKIKKIKQTNGKNMTLLGSGSILTQFADARLIDRYQIMIDPVAIGKGASLFEDMQKPLDLNLTDTRTFKSGAILLCYDPA
ncbi:dihydrofolate reductase family protein [Pedobacter sp. P351]|uniref:dihydrofolate reductase family protein n=1 Tax=Pedobacter superstes TaxID=3133441 RepID=UPI0030B20168